MTTYALLDSGSEYLDLNGPKKKITFGTFHGQDPIIETMKVNFNIRSLDDSFELLIHGASNVPTLNLSNRSYNLKIIQRRWPHLEDVKSSPINYGEVAVLIGAGAQEAHLQLDTRIPPKGIKAPVGILTPFG